MISYKCILCCNTKIKQFTLYYHLKEEKYKVINFIDWFRFFITQLVILIQKEIQQYTIKVPKSVGRVCIHFQKRPKYA